MANGAWARRRKRLVIVLTGLLVALLMLHPEFMHLGMLIDAVGLDTVMLMLEAQLLAAVAMAYRHTLEPLVVRTLPPLARGTVRLLARLPLTRSVAARIDSAFECWSGPLGHYLWLRGHLTAQRRACGAPPLVAAP